jgi:N utilization substance protein A
MSRDILDAMHALAREKGIEPEKLMMALEDALLSAYKKQPGSAKYARVEMDRDTADFRVIELIIPERLEAHLIVETIDEETTIDPETGEMREPEEPEIDPKKFEEYRDQIDERDVTPDDFGRIAAQTAKQVILQRIREAERDMMYEEYRDRVGELITGIVQQSDSRYTLVQLRERVEALLPKSEQVDGERYDHSQRIKAVIKEVSPATKGPAIIVSRRDPELIKKLFELEVPEIADGLVEIANVAREPGYRSKIAVISHADGVDPVGACVGPRGSRVRMVVSELRGEKIDIIPFNDEPARFVAKALSPARVREVLVDDDAKQATVIVPDDQLSLAIGREGQNARLAARLTGWRVDIRSETEFAAEEAEHGYEEEEVQGRCAAILSNGRRCPNAALPGSRYCGLELHQALAAIDSDNVVDLTSEGEPQAGADAEAQATAPQERETAPQEQQAAAGEHAPAETDQTPAEVPAAQAPDVAPDAGLEAAAETELGDGSQPAAHLGADVSEVGVDGTGASEAAAEQAPQAAEAPEPIAGQESAAEPTAEGQGA